jgi:hypothetical protein
MCCYVHILQCNEFVYALCPKHLLRMNVSPDKKERMLAIARLKPLKAVRLQQSRVDESCMYLMAKLMHGRFEFNLRNKFEKKLSTSNKVTSCIVTVAI